MEYQQKLASPKIPPEGAKKFRHLSMQLGIVSSPGQMHLGHLSVHEYFSCLMQLSHVFHVLVQRINLIFRWFKFTLKPPYSITHSKLQLAIWDISFGLFGSNLDTRDLETYPRTYSGHF